MMTTNQIMSFENVRGYVGEDGYTYLLIDDVAKELGYDREEDTNSLRPDLGAKTYHKESIRWYRINNYLAQYGYPSVHRGDFVREDMVYALGIKANNEKAKQFHLKLINVIIPYFKQNVNLNQYNEMVEQYNQLQEKYDNLEEYYSQYINPDYVHPISVVAKDYGMTAQELNKILVKLGIIYKLDDDYAINNKFANLGLAKYYNDLNGKKILGWTNFGINFIFGVLDFNKIYPMTNNTEAINQIKTNKVIATIVPK